MSSIAKSPPDELLRDDPPAKAAAALPSTGERFIPGLGGSIELEHLHRYLFAQQVCGEKVVLDIACGEGYGSAILAQSARTVLGVDIADEAVAHASKRYSARNLRFKVGSCAAIPLGDATVDVVVSFETIEHHDEHEEMMAEIRRVLRPGGVLVISSPERYEYSDRPGTHNEFHVHELYRDEFATLIERHFPHSTLYDQKVLFGSAILSEELATHATSLHVDALHERSHGLVRPLYLIAVASDGPLPVMNTGVFEQPLAETSEWKWWIDTVAERDACIRRLEAQTHEQASQLANSSEAASQLATVTAMVHAVGADRDEAERHYQASLVEIVELQRHLMGERDATVLQKAALEQEVAGWRQRFTEAALERDAAIAERIEAGQRMAVELEALTSRLSAERDAAMQSRQRLADMGEELARAQRTQAQQELELTALHKVSEARQARAVAAEAWGTSLVANIDALRSYTEKLAWVLSITEHALETATARATAQEIAVSDLQARQQALWDSTSWRLTRPLRAAKPAFRAMIRVPRRGAVQVARLIYRLLPLKRDWKTRAKDKVFDAFGFALKDTASYREWLAFNAGQERAVEAHCALSGPNADESIAEDAVPTAPAVIDEESMPAPIPQLAEEVTVMTEPATTEPTYSAGSKPLWVADGRREWEDLEILREGIRSARMAHAVAIVTKPFELISVAPEEIAATARSLSFTRHERPRVSILLPVYNHVAMTLECLVSISRARSDTSFEIVVADDASTDETARVLPLIDGLVIHTNAQNLHFLRNCNAALPRTSGDYVVFLNNDVQVQDGWLDEMLSAFESHDHVGAVGPKIVYPSGHLQEAGVAFNPDMTVDMVGLHDDPDLPRYNYARRVDYSSGACLMVPRPLLGELGGFCEDFAPAYCEDGDLCLRIRERGLFIYYVPQATVVHRLSATTAAESLDAKRRLVANNLVTFANKWQESVEKQADVRTIAFYLPQFYPFPENDRWWGKGFTEWTNVTKAQPNFVGHYQPHLPADLGYYDLRVAKTMEDQVDLARRYGLGGFCFYYYWFAGKRLLDLPIERMLESGKPDFPFCLCWANENWTRRWDGQESHVLMAQSHSDADDEAVIRDLLRYFASPNYIRIDGRPLLVVYRVTLFPDFAQTAARWRELCRAEGVGEIYLCMVESFELVGTTFHPSQYGCDATVEFPPQGLAEVVAPSGAVLNPEFVGHCVDYRALALRYCSRSTPAYTRFRGAMPGWDNTARRQDTSYCIEHATPGGFQAWLEHIVDDARKQHFGDERMVFVNAWNEWAEGAHLEPDRRFGHTYLEALRNAKDHGRLMRFQRYVL